MPVNVGPGGNFECKLAYRKHSSAESYTNEVWEKAVGDVKLVRELVVPATSAWKCEVCG